MDNFHLDIHVCLWDILSMMIRIPRVKITLCSYLVHLRVDFKGYNIVKSKHFLLDYTTSCRHKIEIPITWHIDNGHVRCIWIGSKRST